MNTNMDIGDAHEGRGRRVGRGLRGGGRGGRGGCGRGPFLTGHWQSTDGHKQSTDGERGARGGRGKQRGGRRGGSVDSRQYALPSALSTGTATSVVSTSAAAAFSTGALAASAAVSTCTNATIATGAPTAAAIATGAGATITRLHNPIYPTSGQSVFYVQIFSTPLTPRESLDPFSSLPAVYIPLSDAWH